MAFDPKKMMGSAPIPGENYTSNTKNYPWHRPPEKESFDDAMDAAIDNLTSPKGVLGLFERVEADVSVSDIAATFVMQGVGRGLWQMDMAMIIAGPIARVIEIILKSGGAEYDMGLPSSYGDKVTKFVRREEPIPDDAGIEDEPSEDAVAVLGDEALPMEEPMSIPKNPRTATGFMATDEEEVL